MLYFYSMIDEAKTGDNEELLFFREAVMKGTTIWDIGLSVNEDTIKSFTAIQSLGHEKTVD